VLAEAQTLLEPTTDGSTRGTVAGELLYVALEQADPDAVEQHLQDWRVAVERSPDPSRRWSAEFEAAIPFMIRGELDRAEAAAEAALTLGTETGQHDAFTIYAAQLAMVRYFQGALHELIPVMQEALVAAPELHAYRGAIAFAHARAGNLDAARQLLDAEVATRFDLPEDEGWLATIAYWSSAAGTVRHERAAGLLHSLLEPYRDLFIHSQVVIFSAASTPLGQLEHVLGRFDEADRSFAQADEIHRRLRSPMLLADGHAHWATMLVDRDRPGDRDRAHELAAGALEIATVGGYGYIAATARQVLDQLDR
jgi:tetratricopeptide (TPR) repeat protein